MRYWLVLRIITLIIIIIIIVIVVEREILCKPDPHTYYFSIFLADFFDPIWSKPVGFATSEPSALSALGAHAK